MSTAAPVDDPLAHDQVEHTNLVAASIASATSSSVTDSSGWWLMPPAQRTNSIAVSVTRAIVTASCPAPLGSRRTLTPVSRTAAATRSTSAGVQGVARSRGLATTSTGTRAPRAISSAAARSRAIAALADRVVLVADVERELGAARDHVDRAARDAELADGRHEPGLVERGLLGREHELGRRGGRVAAQVHRRRPGVPGAAREREPRVALARDRGDDAERQPFGLEHRPLLDVHLEVGARRRVVQRRAGLVADRLAQRDALRVAQARDRPRRASPMNARLPR